MFLRCSYFLRNLSLNVLINRVLIKKNACTTDDTWVTSKISNGRTCREDISPDTTCGKRRSHEIVSV